MSGGNSDYCEEVKHYFGEFSKDSLSESEISDLYDKLVDIPYDDDGIDDETSELILEMISHGLFSEYVLPRRYSSYYIAKYRIQELEDDLIDAIPEEDEDEVLKRMYQSVARLGENCQSEVGLKLAVLKSMEQNRHMGMDIRGYGFAAVCSFGSVINTDPPFSEILSRLLRKGDYQTIGIALDDMNIEHLSLIRDEIQEIADNPINYRVRIDRGHPLLGGNLGMIAEGKLLQLDAETGVSDSNE
tara:strand:+ start:397 stop:1128 length:732 start_codon:yes stop_codon:yes gene_type:complete